DLGRARVLNAVRKVLRTRGGALGDEGAAADLPDDAAGLLQLLERAADRVARDAVMLRQLALGRNALAALPAAGLDRVGEGQQQAVCSGFFGAARRRVGDHAGILAGAKAPTTKPIDPR